ncbi:MAG: ATP-dependent DNA ligase [Candidatus Methanomethylicia archaeon]
MRLEELIEAYDKIEGTTKRNEITYYLADLIKKTPKNLIEKVINLTLGQLYPPFTGVEIGVAEKLAMKALAISAGINEKIVEEEYEKIGDLGETAKKILSRKAQLSLFSEPLTVERVYEGFEKMARATGQGAQDIKVRILTSLFNDANPQEAKFIARFVIGKLRLGIADMTILDALAVAFGGSKEVREYIERAYNLCSDIGRVARVLAEEGINGVKKFKISIGNPIRPMLAERLTSAEEILEKLNGIAFVEYKYDGIRIQAHVKGKDVRLFSRRLENITSQFPDVAKNIRDAIIAREAIIEGEGVAVNPDTGEMLPFQMVAHRRGRKYDVEEVAKELPVVFFAFDVLYVDGVDYTLIPFLERRETLAKIIRETDWVKISMHKIAKTSDDLEKYMNEAISNGCEGIMCKSIQNDSVYQAGARGYLWIKYKRSYKGELADTLDLVAIGAFYGKGKRAGSYGALLMAAYDEEKDEFYSICKLGSGFTDEDLQKLPEIFKPYIIPHRHARVNTNMEADVWFIPKLVLEVKADEITLSPLHTCGYGIIKKDAGLALRFPRLVSFRADKSPEQATTIKEVIEMYYSQRKVVTETKEKTIEEA